MVIGMANLHVQHLQFFSTFHATQRITSNTRVKDTDPSKNAEFDQIAEKFSMDANFWRYIKYDNRKPKKNE